MHCYHQQLVQREHPKHNICLLGYLFLPADYLRNNYLSQLQQPILSELSLQEFDDLVLRYHLHIPRASRTFLLLLLPPSLTYRDLSA